MKLSEKYLEIKIKEITNWNSRSINKKRTIDIFLFINDNIKEEQLVNVLLGKGKYGIFKQFPVGGHANEQRNTDYSEILLILFFLVKEKEITEEEITKAFFKIIEIDVVCVFIYLRTFLFELELANTSKDIIFNWRKIIEFVNKEIMNEEFCSKYRGAIQNINSLNLDTKIKCFN